MLFRSCDEKQNVYIIQPNKKTYKATYYRSALDLIDIYRSDAMMNGLKFDSHNEEKAIEFNR